MGIKERTFYTAVCDDCGRLGVDEDDDYGWGPDEAEAIEQVVEAHDWTEEGDRLLCVDCADAKAPGPEEPVIPVVPAVPEPPVDDWCEVRGLPARTMLATGSEAIMREVRGGER